MDPIAIPSIQSALVNWYRKNARKLPWRETSDPYAIWVSEVMLQQTQVNTVIPYYKRFIKRYPDIRSLSIVDQEAVLKTWEGLGYYARARNLHRSAQEIVNHHNGVVPAGWDEFIALPGVGHYIASAVLSIAFNQPYAVVDGNVKRVLARLFQLPEPVNISGSEDVFRAHARTLLDEKKPGIWNQALMELGALICRPRNPGCQRCPLRRACGARQAGRVNEYPKREKKTAVPEYHIAVGVVRKNGRLLITKRKPEGFLGGLWEFPGGKVKKNENSSHACIREIYEETGAKVKVDEHLTTIRHAYTHFKISMDVFSCRWVSGRIRLNGPVAFKWVKPDQLKSFPFPGANRKFLHLIEK